MLEKIKKIIPNSILEKVRPTYHLLLSFLGALIYRFPGNKIEIIGITGTKGKTTTAEIINKILEKAGYETSVASTLRFKMAGETERNLFKMTMPGRFFLQKFLRDSINNKCDFAVIEMTSEGVKQFRHKFIYPNHLIFTNLYPEHIESHGGFEKYKKAKLKIAKEIEGSNKKNKTIVSNIDSKHGKDFLDFKVKNKIEYSIKDVEILNCSGKESVFRYKGVEFHLGIGGEFNILNALASIKLAEALGIDLGVSKEALSSVKKVRGRMEHIETEKDFDVVVDYAHTPDSLRELYSAFEAKHKICILGNTGGGRDRWKRPEMARIADEFCDHIFLTNEDPYDEDPMEIIEQMKEALEKNESEIILDRREAINKALSIAKKDSIVIISGKGTDPYIMKAGGEKKPWDDAEVVREEIAKI